jgi:hypothetical protein
MLSFLGSQWASQTSLPQLRGAGSSLVNGRKLEIEQETEALDAPSPACNCSMPALQGKQNRFLTPKGYLGIDQLMSTEPK